MKSDTNPRQAERDRPAIDKDARPAGRRFQSFTPPEIGIPSRSQPSEASASPADAQAGSKVSGWLLRHRVAAAIALACAAGLLVAGVMKLYVMQDDGVAAPRGTASVVANAPASPSKPVASSDPNAPAIPVPIDPPNVAPGPDAAVAPIPNTTATNTTAARPSKDLPTPPTPTSSHEPMVPMDPPF